MSKDTAKQRVMQRRFRSRTEQDRTKYQRRPKHKAQRYEEQ